MFHVDQPENDFSTLFSTLRSEPQSYSLGAPFVFGCAVGRSFYEPVLPAGTVSVGWSSAAAHWLSRTPAALTEHLWAPTARSPGAAPFAEQARRDWHSFVRLRADELRPGEACPVEVSAGEQVRLVERRGSWGRLAEPGGGRCWLHETAWSDREAGELVGDPATASQRDLELAGRGFSEGEERRYRADHPDLAPDFALVEAYLARAPETSPAELPRFLAGGKLGGAR